MNVRFYGRLADMLGQELQLDVPASGCSVAEVRAWIAEANPEAKEEILSSRNRACVGDALVLDAHHVGSAATVEFFPPVSGG